MNKQMKPIETKYKGYRFRSRLEARWAVFFDALGIKWLYEDQGYELSDGTWYLPDFYLPDIREGTFVEVKPDTNEADALTRSRIRGLVAATRKQAMIVKGDPYEGVDCAGTGYNPDPPGNYNGSAYWMHFPCSKDVRDNDTEIAVDGPYLFCVCPVCSKVGIEFDGRGERVCADCTRGDKGYSNGHLKIVTAAIKARSARFEHGESGAPA